MAKIGGPKAIEALIVLFNDPIMEVRNEAVAAVVSLGVGQLDRLLAAMKDERWRVREHAAKAYGDLHDSRAVDALGEAHAYMDTDQHVGKLVLLVS